VRAVNKFQENCKNWKHIMLEKMEAFVRAELAANDALEFAPVDILFANS
jgi:hypothetical protein